MTVEQRHASGDLFKVEEVRRLQRAFSLTPSPFLDETKRFTQRQQHPAKVGVQEHGASAIQAQQ